MASVFSQIRTGKLPGQLVWQDEQVFALLTIRPLQAGHVLVMPVQEIDHWDDLPEELLTHVMQVSRRLAKAIKAAFPCARVAVAICGLEIAHAHVHLFPVDRIEDFNFGNGQSATTEELADAAQRIRAALAANS
ncbi:MAG TPA: HIT family protein [Spongiibacteraceae bacterium]|nr:HIT family protein [Spongiibacteraceae bacterium]